MNCFAANLASNSYVKFATNSIATKLLAKLNYKIANLGLGYLQNLLWIVLVADFAAKFICGFSCRNKTCEASCKNYLRNYLRKLLMDLLAKITFEFSYEGYLRI